MLLMKAAFQLETECDLITDDEERALCFSEIFRETKGSEQKEALQDPLVPEEHSEQMLQENKDLIAARLNLSSY